jgi:anti-sigma factor RsiW
MAARKTTVKALTSKTCKQIADLVFNYINDTLSPRVKRDFNQHLTICPDCVAFLNTYRKTVAVTRSVRAEEIPAKVSDNILDFLRRRARQNRTSA